MRKSQNNKRVLKEPYSVFKPKKSLWRGFVFFWRYLFLPITQNSKKGNSKNPTLGSGNKKNLSLIKEGKEDIESVNF